MDYFIELLFSGLTRGAIYALIALGYTMVYGIIGLINFAHGEIYMIGAFTALIISTVLTIYGLPLPAILILTAIAAAVWASALGGAMARSVGEVADAARAGPSGAGRPGMAEPS